MITTDHFQNDGGAGLVTFQDLGAESYAHNPEKPLAKGVLRQAAEDLRLFHAAQDRVGRALYIDAYTWVLSDDTSWPYSFVNVCHVLGLSCEVTRTELFVNANSRWYSRSLRTAKKISTSLRNAFITAFGGPLEEKPKRTVLYANSI
jgi:hypothetical protein